MQAKMSDTDKLLFAIFGKTAQECSTEYDANKARVKRMLEEGMTPGAVQNVLEAEGMSRTESYEIVGEAQEEMK